MEGPPESEQEIWDKLFRPELLETFFDPYPEVTSVSISLFTTLTGPPTETIVIDSFFPFSTIDDLKVAIFLKKGKNPAFAPLHQFLAKPISFPPPAPGERAKYYEGLDFYYVGKNLLEPFTAATQPTWDSKFVDSEGNRKIVQGASRGRSCFEDVVLRKTSGIVPQIHLFLLKDILSAVRAPKPLSEAEYNGRILSYFPSSTIDSDGTTLPKSTLTSLTSVVTYYESKQSILENKLTKLLNQESINNETDPYIFETEPKVKDVRYLRFVWLQKSGPKQKPLDTLFYEVPVKKERPFLRFYPADSAPVTKVLVKGTLPIPAVEDSCLLLQWAKEKSPTTERDFLLGKVAVERLFEGSTQIYATLQAVDDGTAALIIEPPKPLKRLDPLTDLKLLGGSIVRGIQGFPFAETRAEINEANLVASLRLPAGQKKLTAKELESRFQLFRGFFQQISPLKGETPLLALRYKAVSNFFNESRVLSYFQLLFDREKDNLEKMIDEVAEEFSLTKDQARVEFNKWKETKEEIVPIEPEYDLYELKYNPGIDIFIYAQHPDYFFHFYRIDSYINFRRILTLLRMMISVPKEVLGIAPKQKKELDEAAKKVIPKLGEDSAEGLVGSSALAANGRMKTNPVAVEEDVDVTDVGDAGELAEWDMFDADEGEEERIPTSAAAFESSAVPKQIQAPAPPQQVEVQGSKLTIPTANYFIRKLQEADSRLFEYTKGIKGLKKYVSICAANEHRQPAVLDKAGYDRMLLEYKPDLEANEIDIITYEFEKGLVSQRKTPLPYKTKKDLEEHTFMVLKYGTDITNQKYYLCAEYFCLHDELLIRKDEFEGTKFRANADVEFVGKKKEPNRCPFCNGKLITNFPEVRPGETVFPREVKISNKLKKHTHIGFYSKRIHPDGYGLPCCFTSPQKILPSDEWFNPLREMSKRLKKAGAEFEEGKKEEDENENEDDEDETPAAAPSTGFKVPNYQDTLQRAYRKYIVGPEKMPLEIGDEPQIGLLPPALNEYFQQEISDLTQRAQIRQELKADAKGFLRIGVDNRGGHRAESFFSAIAPFLNLNSADQVRALLKLKITPKIFVNANYGNLMMEFFDPNVPVRPIFEKEIKDWGSRRLQIKNKEQYWYIKRIYKSWIHFWGEEDERRTVSSTPSFLDDKTRTKEYRQFASILAQPNLLSKRGILFIVLDILEDGSISVQCPPYGYNETMRNCDIGILLHQGDIWEPIFYTENFLPTATQPALHLTRLLFQKSLEASWPLIFGKRVEEFRTRCKGPSTAPYTGIQMLKPNAKLLNLSLAVRLFPEPYSVWGIVRDTYNHVVACVFKSDPEREDSPLIAFPVTDDGIIRSELSLYLNWDGFTAAPVNQVLEFYTQIQPILSIYKGIAAGYEPMYQISPGKSELKAIQLANGIFIPVSPPESGTELTLPTPPEGQPEELEWSINKKITYYEKKAESTEKETVDILKIIQTEKEYEELFQHFRLTFANWLAGSVAGPELRQEIAEVIYPATKGVGFDLPIYEKRKRLEILLSPMVYSWVDTSEKKPTPFQTLLRVDCKQEVTKDKCKNPCVWKGEGEGGCFLHIPPGGPKSTLPTPEIFLSRLIEELIRFPSSRAELLPADLLPGKEKTKHVSNLITLTGPVRLGDTFIIPEDNLNWVDVLRIECKKSFKELPKYFEEFSVEDTSKPVAVAETTPELPEQLQVLLGGADPKTKELSLSEWDRLGVPEGKDLQAVLQILEIPLDSIELTPVKREFTSKELLSFVKQLGFGILQINLDAEDPTRMVTGFLSKKNREVFILVKQGNSMKFLVRTRDGDGPIKEEILPDLFAARIQKMIRL